MNPKFLDPHAEIAQHGLRLPHWQQDGATYFVTFRLADSIPATLLEQWRQERDIWLRLNPPPRSVEQEKEYFARFPRRIEQWLDELHGVCLLRESTVARTVGDVLMRFDQKRYTHHAWVIMPNHVHLLFSLAPSERLEKTLQGWKGVSAREVNGNRKTRAALWQKDYFDRMIRDTPHFWRCARYIRRNPVKAGLNQGEFLLFETERVRATLDGEATLLSPE